MSEGQKKVIIVTGESSGELYGSLLARNLKKQYEGIKIFGVGGDRMRAEGVQLIGEVTGAFGITEAFSSLSKLQQNFDRIVKCLEADRPDVVVLIDFPDFNLRVAKVAKSIGLKVLYYVSPQIWAWRKGRIKKITALTDRIAVILPFEEELYRNSGADCEFVGHPIMEEIETIKGSKEYIREQLGLRPEGNVMAILPGSRNHELKRLLPLYYDVITEFKRSHGEFQFVLPLAPNIDFSEHQAMFRLLKDAGVNILKGRATEALSASDLGLIASGTATLQAALVGVPMVVVYKLFPLTYLIGRLIVDVKFISLVNILMGKEVVKELIQWKATRDNVIRELEKLLYDDSLREYMMESFRQIRQIYQGRHPSERVAELIGELAGWR